MKNICVYCGSSFGAGRNYEEAARQIGYLLADRSIGIVYGGAKIGLMGVVASAARERAGTVIGVMPSFLFEQKRAHQNLSEIRVVDTMHERKHLMASLSDAFIALPGGLGTLDEMFEMLTWLQLKLHSKPCGFLNVTGYFNKLFEFLDHAVEQDFIKRPHRDMIFEESNPEQLVSRFENFNLPATTKF